jgi:hypothetical protein
MELYTSAVSLFHQALSATENPFLKNDAAFNLAQAMSSFADVTDELEGPSSAEASREFRVTATKMLAPVLSAQIMYLQNKDAIDQSASAPEASTAPAAPVEGEEMDVDSGDKSAKGPTAEDLENINYPTPDSLVDTILMTVDLGTTMWEGMTPPQPPSDGEQQSIREMLELARHLGPLGRQAEIDLAETKVLLAFDAIMWDIYRDEVQPGLNIERNGEMAVKAMERILQTLETQPANDATVKADILATIANTELSSAQRYITLAQKFTPAEQYGAGAWAQLSSAAGHYNTALKLPISASTPKEFRPSAYIELLKNTLLRARLAPICETSARNSQALFDNCSAYGVKASEALGWNYPHLPSSKTGMTPFYSEPLSTPHPAGWDMEMLSRDLALTLLRVCFYAKDEKILTEPGTQAMYEMAAKSIVDSIVSVPAGPRRLMPVDIGRYVGDIEDEEGKITPEEDAWWKEVGQGIRRGLDDNMSKAAQAVQNMFD